MLENLTTLRGRWSTVWEAKYKSIPVRLNDSREIK